MKEVKNELVYLLRHERLIKVQIKNIKKQLSDKEIEDCLSEFKEWEDGFKEYIT